MAWPLVVREENFRCGSADDESRKEKKKEKIFGDKNLGEVVG